MKTDNPTARSSRRSAGLQSIINLILVAFILGACNYLGFKYYKHVDLSASQFYTLSEKTKDVLKKIDSPITIYTYLDEKNEVQADQIATLLREYQQAGGKNISVEKIDPLFDINRAAALQKELHFDGNDHLVIFSYKDHSPRFVKQEDLYDLNPMTQQVGAFKGEQQFTSTITSMLEGKVSRIYFTEGHGEHPAQDSTTRAGYGAVVESLKNDNMETANLNLAQKGDVPSDADAVVIAGPAISFSPIEVEALDKYLANNGKLLVLLDPYITSGLDNLLKKYGLKFDDDLVLTRGMSTLGAMITAPQVNIYQGGFSTHPITAKFAQANYQLIIFDARSVSLLPDEKGQPNPKLQFLLQTDPTSWGWINKAGTPPTAPEQVVFNKATDIPPPVTIAAEYDGGSVTNPATKATGTATRIVAVGCAKFLENDVQEPVGANFFVNCLDWLVKKDAVLDIAPKKPQEYGVTLSPMQGRTVGWTALFFIPGAALLLGIFTWFSRRK